MDDLGTDDKTINNMNLIKIWQHVLKRFISSRVIRGGSLVEMSGGFWILLVQCELKKEVLQSYPFSENLLSSQCHETCL